MKSSAFCLFSVLSCTIAIAQVPQGSLMLSGGLCYDQDRSIQPYFNGTDYTDLETKESEFGLAVGVGYAFADNHLAGLKLDYGLTSVQEDNFNFTSQVIDTYLNKGNSVSIAPMYRYYHPCSPKFAVVGELSIPFSFHGGTSSIELGEGTNPPDIELPNRSGFGAWITPSFAWFPTGNWSLEASIGKIGYSMESYTDDLDNEFSNSSLGAKLWTLKPRFSFSYYFGDDLGSHQP